MAVDPLEIHVGDVLVWSEDVPNKNFVGREAVVVGKHHDGGDFLQSRIIVECTDTILGRKATRRVSADGKYLDMKYHTFCDHNKELDSLFCELS